MKTLMLALLAALVAMPAAAAKHVPPKGEPLKLPKFLSFGQKNTAVLANQHKTIEAVKAYLDHHVEITLLRLEGYRDQADDAAAGQAKGAARAWAAGEALVKAGIDCKRLLPVAGKHGNGDMREGGAYVTFINAALKGKPIGGMPVDGGGKVAGDLCSGKKTAAGATSGASEEQPAASGKSASKGSSATGSPSVVCGAAGLSAARQKMFAELDQVIPSIQGQAAHPGGRNLFDGTHQMTQAEFDAAHAAKRPVATTCGLLPGVMLKHLGLKGPLTANGTEGLRLCGHGMGPGVFVEADGTNEPKPGDLYWLRYPKTPGTDSVAHVGIICQTGPDAWKTADAGQGPATRQEAQIVTRRMKKTDGTHQFLSGPGTVGDSADFRRIGGWIDLDALMAAQDKAAGLKLVIKGNSATCK